MTTKQPSQPPPPGPAPARPPGKARPPARKRRKATGPRVPKDAVVTEFDCGISIIVSWTPIE